MTRIESAFEKLAQAIRSNEAKVGRRALLYVRQFSCGRLRGEALAYLAAEAVGEAYAQLFKPEALDRFDVDRDAALQWVLAFVWQTAHAVTAKELRRCRRSVDATPSTPEGGEDVVGSPSEPCYDPDSESADTASDTVEAILARLSSSDAELLRARYLEDTPAEELAHRLGIGIDALYCRLNRARARARAR